MRNGWLRSFARGSTGCALIALSAVSAAAQTAPRTSWGDPDLGGIWDYRTITPLERPEEYGEREFLTLEEVADLEQGAEDRERTADEAPARRAEAAKEGDNPLFVVGCCNRFWMDYGTRVAENQRTSLIIDPPNGRKPPTTPDGQAPPEFRGSFGSHAFEHIEDFSYGDRCLGTFGIPVHPIPYNNNVQLFQTQDHLVMLVGMMRTVRIIPIGERPRGTLSQWRGESRGHWEGDTLVVETANFANRLPISSASPNARLVERFRRVSPDILEYTYTMHDPTVWTAPWTAVQTWRASSQPLFEYACHEGNYGLTNMLAGARVEERAVATKAESFPHTVRTAKFTVAEVEASAAFYEDMFGMTEFNRFVAEGRLIEPFLGYQEDARLGLLGFIEHEAIEKSPYPVAVVYSGAFDEVTKGLEAAGHPLTRLEGPETGGIRIAITRDPSGNAIEIIDRAGASAVGGSRLIVESRQEAEDFFVRLFGGKGVAPGQRFQTEAFDEVIMDFGGDMFVALFEPKGIAPLPKSEHPVVAIYTTEFDAILERVVTDGLTHRKFSEGMFLVNDPSGNVVEIVRQRAE